MIILTVFLLVCSLAVSIYLIEQLFTEHSRINFVPKTKLDIPLSDDYILILSRPMCFFCEKLKQYIHENKTNINYKLVIVDYNNNNSFNFNSEYAKLSDEEKTKITDIIDYNKNNPYFGFPTMYKKDIIQVGFDIKKADYFFKN